MRKFLLSFVCLFTASLCLWGCSGDPNEKANKLYVEASMDASEFLGSSKEWDGSYLTLYDSYIRTKDRIDLILSKYPSSDIAVGLSSGKIKISGLTLRQFKVKEDFVNLIHDAEQSPFSTALLLAEITEDVKEKYFIYRFMAESYASAGQEKKVTYLLSRVFEDFSTMSTYDKSRTLYYIACDYAKFGHFQQAFKLAKTIGDADLKSKTLINIAAKYVEAGQNEKAALLLSQALVIAKTSGEYKSRRLDDIADIYINIGLLDEACKIINSRDYESSTYSSSEEKINKFLKISAKHIEAGQNEKAALLLSQALDIATDLPPGGFNTDTDLAIKIAKQYAKNGQNEEATQLFGQASAAVDLINDRETKLRFLIFLKCQLASVTKTEYAVQLLSEALESAKSLESRADRKHELCRIAGIYAALGMLNQSIAVLSTNKLDHSSDSIDVFRDIAGNYADRGEIDQAFTFIKSISDSDTKFGVLVKFVDKYAAIGQKKQTENLLSETLEIIEATDDARYGNYKVLWQISELYKKAGLKEQESQLLFQAFEALIAIEEIPFKIEYLSNIATHYAEVGEEDLVAKLISQYLQYINTIKNTEKKSYDKARALATIASMLDKIGRQPSSKDKLILHDIVTSLDPMSLLRVDTE